MTNVVVLGKDWAIVEDLVDDSLWLDVDLPEAVYTANQDGVEIRLPASVIDAIRSMPANQIPHLRRARKEVFSERSKRGWVTRRSDREDRLVLEESPVNLVGTITSSCGTLRCKWSEPETAGVLEEGCKQLVGFPEDAPKSVTMIRG